MGFDHEELSATITIPRPSRRLLAALREAVLNAQQDPNYPKRRGRELTEIAIRVKGENIQLICEFGNTTPE